MGYKGLFWDRFMYVCTSAPLHPRQGEELRFEFVICVMVLAAFWYLHTPQSLL